jgi:Zn-dependent peptidase ImmA (M78 family)/DNA-binding XRE family transcriptional regulator
MKPGTPGFVGARLREAREGRGVSAASLAEMLSLTRAAIYQYESDEQSPRPSIMERICAVLNLPTAFFVRPITNDKTGLIFYRSLSGTKQQARARVERRLGWVHDIADALREHIDFPRPNIPEFDLPSDPLQLSQDEIETIAADARKHWELDNGPLGSVVNLLEKNGAIISRDDFLADEVDALSQWRNLDGVPYFLLNDRKRSAARSRMDLCHEIGHVLLHRKLSREDFVRHHRLVEDQAFRFGGAFALPLESFVAELETGSLTLDFFQELKTTWKMSVGMMIKRTEDLGLLTETQAQRLWQKRARNGWHLREPLDDELPIESPRLLPKAIHMAVDNKALSRQSLLAACPFAPNDIEVLGGLEKGYLADPEAMPAPRVLNFPGKS